MEQQQLPPLKIVPIKDVYPHEEFDQDRFQHLAKKIRKDQVFLNPPLVAQFQPNKYMVLDGANRVNALRFKLKSPHILIQEVDYTDASVKLGHWNHLIYLTTRQKRNFFKELAQAVPADFQLYLPLKKARRLIQQKKLAAYIHDNQKPEVLGIKCPASLKEKLAILRTVVNLYNGRHIIKRVEEEEFKKWGFAAPADQLMIVFLNFTKQELLSATRRHYLFPCGLTRHIIPKRVLHVNLDLKTLRSKKICLEDKRKALADFLTRKIKKGRIRFYAEPTYVIE